MLDTFQWPQPEEAADEILIGNVRRHGCHIMTIAGSERIPAYAFSIGLYLNHAQAEIVIFGLAPERACALINDICARAAAGKLHVDGDVSDDLLVDRKACFVAVPLRAYDAYLGTAVWFYAKSPRPFPCLQLVWQDREGRFPWQSGCDEGFRKLQPVLKSLS